MFNDRAEQIINGFLGETHDRLLKDGHAMPYPPVMVPRSTARNETRSVQCRGMVGSRRVGSSALRIALRTSAWSPR
jgi:hypothetical protein